MKTSSTCAPFHRGTIGRKRRWALAWWWGACLLVACSGAEQKGNDAGQGDAGAFIGGDAGDADGGHGDGDGDGRGDGDGDGDGHHGPVSCTPVTCEARGYVCGRVDDGCGGSLSCGACKDGKYCAPDSHQCVEPMDLCMTRECGAAIDACDDPVVCGSACAAGEVCKGGLCAACVPRDCAGENLCGDVSDGCGGTLHCAACAEGQACDQVTHQCTTCAPTSCLGAGAECGTISDGCGGTLDCKACAADKMCVSGKCVAKAAPMECTAQGANCGDITHACTGAKLNCGKCVAGEACVNNVCKSCVPASCSEKSATCGDVDDGCGGKLHCGDCDGQAGEVCNKGSCCVPTTCAAQGKGCGDISDGCGGTLHCGDCDPLQNQFCGYKTSPNVCGTCVPTTTCADAGKQCGKFNDGCKDVYCGDCEANEYCGSGGTANTCVQCDPSLTCAGWSVAHGGKQACGVIKDPCGDHNCGDCAASNEKCEAGGTANICDVCVPTPNVCAGKNCGTVWDGCNNVRCGSDTCGAGETCGANGVANVCGVCAPVGSCESAGKICGTYWNGCANEDCKACGKGEKCINNGTQCCAPKTCADHASQCGDIDDGCGGTLHCDCPSQNQSCFNGSCCVRRTCQEIANQIGGNDPVIGCVDGNQENFIECGEIVQCGLCLNLQ